MTTDELRAIAEDESGDAITRADRFHEVFDRARILAMLDVIEATRRLAEAIDEMDVCPLCDSVRRDEEGGETAHDEDCCSVPPTLAALARLKEMER